MAANQRQKIDGVLLLDKPLGLSSNTALQHAKRLLNAKKAGHTGTLDPLATGLLPLCFGEATKFSQGLLDADKTYRATVRFGITTATGDAEGEILAWCDPDFDRVALEAVLPRFVGRITQLPPVYSALKLNGKPYYEYARAGVEIERTAREVDVHEIVLESFALPDAVLSVRCGKGTYIRTLAEDIGGAVGCGAHLVALRRTGTGGFALEDAITLEQLEALPPDARHTALLPVDALLTALPEVTLNAADALRFRQGGSVRHAAAAGLVRVYEAGRLLGIAVADGQELAPRRVIVPA